MATATLPRELLHRGFSVRVRVTGRSMAPYLVHDDLVTLEPVGAADVSLGDLVYVQQPGLPPLLHRVIGRSRGVDGRRAVLTKGDALVMIDTAVSGEFVAGRVVAIRRNLPAGLGREVRLRSRHRRILQRCLALTSRHAPRSFAAVSRRLVPALERLAGRVRRRS